MSAVTYSKSGSKASVQAKLAKNVFEVEVTNHDLLKAVYTAYLANGRVNLAKTKTRGDVSGGGKKPWRQKGTGRARFGSSRVPIWRKGGVAHGPTGTENYTHYVSTTSKRLGLMQALSLKNKAGALIVIEEFEVKSGKASDARKLLSKMSTASKLVLVGKLDETTKKSVRNLANLSVISPKALSAFSVLNADTIILTKVAVEELETRLGAKA